MAAFDTAWYTIDNAENIYITKKNLSNICFHFMRWAKINCNESEDGIKLCQLIRDFGASSACDRKLTSSAAQRRFASVASDKMSPEGTHLMSLSICIYRE